MTTRKLPDNSVQVRAFPDKDLDEVAKGINEAFAKFEKERHFRKRFKPHQSRTGNSILQFDFERFGQRRTACSIQLFDGNDPGFVEKDIKNILAVTPADVMRVYEKYIKGKNFVATSFVPKGKVNLAL